MNKQIARASIWLLLVGLPAVASGGQQPTQDSDRASVLVAEREKKASDTSPPARSAVERALYWYDNQYVLPKIFGGWKGFHLAGGDFPAGAGFKYGVGFTRGFGSPPEGEAGTLPRAEIDMVAASSTRGYKRGSGAVSVRRMAGAPLDLRVRAQYYEFPQEDFFGIGPDTSTDDRTSYLLESREAAAEVQWTPVKMVEIIGGLAYVSPTIGSGTDSRFPSTEQRFDAASVPGFTEQPDFLRSDAGVAFDWRDNPLHPHAGGRYGVAVSNYQDRDLDAFGFQRVQVDLQQYVPLPHRYRILALRASAVLTDPHAGEQVPFYYQPTLGGAQQLRGFREFRFRDQNSLLFTAEYRWEAWWALDGALFVDAGTVAAERRDLALRDLDLSYGIGFRVHSNSAFVARLDLAFSREGFIPLLRFEHVF